MAGGKCHNMAATWYNRDSFQGQTSWSGKPREPFWRDPVDSSTLVVNHEELTKLRGGGGFGMGNVRSGESCMYESPKNSVILFFKGMRCDLSFLNLSDNEPCILGVTL